MSAYYLGIDPGFTGAVAVLHEFENENVNQMMTTVLFHDAPVIKIMRKKKKGAKAAGFRQEFDLQGMLKILRRYAGPHTRGFTVFAAIEDVGTMPEQGISSAFRFGQGFGYWEMALAALDIPYRKVRPEVWKRRMMEGMGAKEKGASILRALQLHPTLTLNRKKDHGRADALLIAEHARYDMAG